MFLIFYTDDDVVKTTSADEVLKSMTEDEVTDIIDLRDPTIPKRYYPELDPPWGEIRSI